MAPNGSGKTTSFKAILGLIPIDGGQITILDKSLNQITPADRQAIGVVLADSGFSAYLNLNDIIDIAKNMYLNFDKTFFLTQAARFNLPLNQKIKTFSSGMKAKLKLLFALSHQAKLLILDEPTAGLDVIARDELLDLLRSYMEEDENRSILISSHISSDLENLCDDLYMLDKGKIILHEDTDVLLSDYALLKLNEKQYQKIDKNYLLCQKEESYGYACLTKNKTFYAENYPDIVISKCGIDEVITMMIRREA